MPFVIMNFVDASKKRINPKKKMENMGENVFKFWTTEILKELVIIVGNEPVLINNFFHYGIIWIKNGWCPKGHDFEKIE